MEELNSTLNATESTLESLNRILTEDIFDSDKSQVTRIV